MVTRNTHESARVLGPEQAITREEAPRLYATNGARTQSAENETGSMETGKLADKVVPSDGLLIAPPEQIKDVEAQTTAFERERKARGECRPPKEDAGPDGPLDHEPQRCLQKSTTYLPDAAHCPGAGVPHPGAGTVV